MQDYLERVEGHLLIAKKWIQQARQDAAGNDGAHVSTIVAEDAIESAIRELHANELARVGN